MRRPAAAVGVVRRRPAAAPHAATPLEKWTRGEEVDLHEVNLESWATSQFLIITKGVYFGQEVQLAGEVQRLEMEGGQLHVLLKAKGTPSDAILAAQTQSPGQLFKVHRCPSNCGQVETGDLYVHGMKGRLSLDPTKEANWTTNMVSLGNAPEPGADDLEALRKRAEALAEEAEKSKKEKEGESKKEEKKKKKKKRKRKSSDGADSPSHLDGRSPVKASIKEPSSLFAGTGLDPKEKIQRRVFKSARNFIQKKDKKKESSSSEGEGSDSSPSEDRDTGLEGLESSKAKMVSEKFPGVLCAEAMASMQQTLLLEVGEDTSGLHTRPIATMYYRQHLKPRAGGAAARELLNISSALDALLRGRPALCGDILAQRLKSAEASMLGTHYSVAQRMEVPMQEAVAIAARPELAAAQKESYQDQRTKYLASSASGRKPEDQKNKGGKGNPHDRGRGDKDKRGRDQRGKDYGKPGKGPQKGDKKD